FLESLPRESEWCFPKGKRCQSKNTEVIGHSEVRRRVDKYLEKAGLPHMKVHGFRHSCVSYLLSKGMSYRTVARWVGDTEQVVLQTYSHLLPDEKDEIAKFIDSIGEE
ncbi:MAG: tyrosine-type recombinase/integrase, partial [Bacilli bacterium]|nr:tyrosine-type recombinase/integrase [Bacilli bacterium]